ncbi:adenosylmethionine decarboxylase [Fictibacillus iocasae]|uniref:S-adenosylmethionine decarboxylase proenzyme n=1 Tax=Fictibacillus iocasae TaxID=2715437 RepID=A0ABW2NUE7_9BACL
METKGFHIIIDAFLCDEKLLNSADRLEASLIKIAEELNMEVLHTYFHAFQPHGVTGVLVLSTSHMSVHTWPEKRYASLDIYTCGDSNPLDRVDAVISSFSSEYAVVYDILRGEKRQRTPGSIVITKEN